MYKNLMGGIKEGTPEHKWSFEELMGVSNGKSRLLHVAEGAGAQRHRGQIETVREAAEGAASMVFIEATRLKALEERASQVPQVNTLRRAARKTGAMLRLLPRTR